MYIAGYIAGWIVFSLFFKFIKHLAFYEKTYIKDKPKIPSWRKKLNRILIILLVIFLITPIGFGVASGIVMYLAIFSWMLLLVILLTPLGWLGFVGFSILTCVIYAIKKKLQQSKTS